MAAQPGHPSRFHDQGTAGKFSANEKFHGTKEPNGARRIRYRAVHPDALASDPTNSSTTRRVTMLLIYNVLSSM